MSFQWSFSTDKLFRRCQRQFFFREIAAHPNAKDGWRREAFILRQLKTLELWDRFKDGVYWEAEVPIWVKLPEVSIKAQIDLLLERPGQRFTIIDWKSYEIGGDTDARLQTAIYGWALLRSGEHKVRNPESIELLECQVQEGLLVDHGFSQELVDTLDDYIYRSVQTIFSLCQSKKLADVQLQDFAFTDNPNNCDHCAFRKLCVERASSASSTETAVKPPRLKKQAIPSLF